MAEDKIQVQNKEKDRNLVSCNAIYALNHEGKGAKADLQLQGNQKLQRIGTNGKVDDEIEGNLFRNFEMAMKET